MRNSDELDKPAFPVGKTDKSVRSNRSLINKALKMMKSKPLAPSYNKDEVHGKG